MSRFLKRKQKYKSIFKLSNSENKPITNIEIKGEIKKIPIYSNGDNITASVIFNVKSGSKIEHQGVRVDLIGRIEVIHDSSLNYVFLKKSKKLCGSGTLTHKNFWDVEFENPNLKHESYEGTNVKLKYFLLLTIIRSMINIKEQVDFWVMECQEDPEKRIPVQMEVGIKKVLHIDFTYGKSTYHMNDVVIGRINYYLARIQINHMEVCVVRKESSGSGPNKHTETDILSRYEVMDGAPVKGESIPVRIFMKPINLTPTFKRIENVFSVRYYLNLVLVDEHKKKYFKQAEINMYRKSFPQLSN